MTSIAYHHGDKEIATDSRITCGGIIQDDKASKTIKNEYGLWFFAGAVSDCIDLSTLKHNDKVYAISDCTAFLVSPTGVYFVCVNNDMYCQHTLLNYNDAMGSGREFTLAAMDFGKSAKEAVKYAMTRDVYTGGRIRVFKVGNK